MRPSGDDLSKLRKSFEEILDSQLPRGPLATQDDLLTREDVEEIAVETLDEVDEEADEDYPWSAREIKDAFDEVLPEDPDKMYPEEKAAFIREHKDDVVDALQDDSPTEKSVRKRSPEELSEAIGSVIPPGVTSRLATAEWLKSNTDALEAIYNGADPSDVMEKSSEADDPDPDLSNLTKTFLPFSDFGQHEKLDPELSRRAAEEWDDYPDVDTPADEIPALSHFYGSSK